MSVYMCQFCSSSIAYTTRPSTYQTHRKLRILQHKRLQLGQKARPLLRREHRVQQTLALCSDPVPPSLDSPKYARRSALHFVLSAFGDAVDFFRHGVVVVVVLVVVVIVIATAAILRAGGLCLSLSGSCRRGAGRLALADLEFPRGVFPGGRNVEVPRGRVFEAGVVVVVVVIDCVRGEVWLG
jgi:hypothetical protein